MRRPRARPASRSTASSTTTRGRRRRGGPRAELDRHLARSVENRLDAIADACRARSKAARARAENAAKARRKASPGPFLTAVDDDDDDAARRGP